MTKRRIGRYNFDLADKLPSFSNAWGDAYATAPHPEHPDGLCAYVLSHQLPTRLDIFESLNTAKVGALQNVLDYEVVPTPAGARLGFILELPPGPPLAKDLKQATFTSYKEDTLRAHLVAPLFATIKTFYDRTLFHGSISPTNIYAGSGLGRIMLGECVTLPAGYRQPALLEPIERATCRTEGKGDSTTEDDLFALGVTTYLMALGHNPFGTMSDDDVIRARLDVGTSTLMLNYAKLQPSILELVRGLCNDTPRQRWSLTELENWLNGQRVPPRNVTYVAKASRALPFNGKDYTRARTLAGALPTNPAEVRKLIDNKEILRWLNRSLGDMPMYEEAYHLIEKTPLTTTSNEMAAAHLAMVLDPQGPIRYKSIQVMPMAIGTCLAKAYADQDVETQKILGEILSSELIPSWISQPGNGSPFMLEMAKEMERAKDYMFANGMGNGPERVLYELQRYAPCYSDIFQGQYILSPKQAVPALAELANSNRRPTEPLDRHLSAFFSARMSRGKETMFTGGNTQKDETRRGLATLDLMAQAQSRFSIGPVPKLATWLLDNLRPALDRFHNRTLRQNLEDNLSKIASLGDLSVLLRAIDSPEVVEGDLRGFKDAIRRFRYLSDQIKEITILMENKNTVGEVIGHRVAAVLAVVLSMVAVGMAMTLAVQ